MTKEELEGHYKTLENLVHKAPVKLRNLSEYKATKAAYYIIGDLIHHPEILDKLPLIIGNIKL